MEGRTPVFPGLNLATWDLSLFWPPLSMALRCFFMVSNHSAAIRRNIYELSTPLTYMTRLTITEDSGDEFTLRGHNTASDSDDDEVVFYNDISKVHVVPERQSFTIQVVTPAFVVEMDFPDVDRVHEALDLFEAKKVLEVDFDAPNSVRITPSPSEPAEA
jgi:hypothetical protein